jgi:hypothetical protein
VNNMAEGGRVAAGRIGEQQGFYREAVYIQGRLTVCRRRIDYGVESERGEKVLVLSHLLSQKEKEVRRRSEKGRNSWTSGRTKKSRSNQQL